VAEDQQTERWTIWVCPVCGDFIGRCGAAHDESRRPVEVVSASLLKKVQATASRLDNEAVELAENFRQATRDLREAREREVESAQVAERLAETLEQIADGSATRNWGPVARDALAAFRSGSSKEGQWATTGR
jgi:hypothetical protein